MKSNASNIDAHKGGLPTGTARRGILGKTRVVVLLSAVLAILGSVGSALGIVFAARTILAMGCGVAGDQLRWGEGMTPFFLGIVHASVMAIAYAIVAWQSLRYARTLRSASMETAQGLQALLERQYALVLSIVCAGGLYVVSRTAGAVIGAVIR